MADTGVTIGLGVATWTITEVIRYVLKKIRAVAKGKKECKNLENLLTSTLSDVEKTEHVVGELRKFDPDTTVVDKVLRKLHTELVAASKVVDRCSNWYSLSTKIPTLHTRIEMFALQVPSLYVTLQTRLDLLEKMRSQKVPAGVPLQEASPVLKLDRYVREKDIFLGLEDETRRREAASHSTLVHSNHGGPGICVGGTSQHSFPYMNHPNSHGGLATYAGDMSQHTSPQMNHPDPQFPPSLFMNHVSDPQFQPSYHGNQNHHRFWN